MQSLQVIKSFKQIQFQIYFIFFFPDSVSVFAFHDMWRSAVNAAVFSIRIWRIQTFLLCKQTKRESGFEIDFCVSHLFLFCSFQFSFRHRHTHVKFEIEIVCTIFSISGRARCIRFCFCSDAFRLRLFKQGVRRVFTTLIGLASSDDWKFYWIGRPHGCFLIFFPSIPPSFFFVVVDFRWAVDGTSDVWCFVFMTKSTKPFNRINVLRTRYARLATVDSRRHRFNLNACARTKCACEQMAW